MSRRSSPQVDGMRRQDDAAPSLDLHYRGFIATTGGSAVPPCTALLAWLIFGEALTVGVLLGLLLTAAGVGLVVRSPVPR